LDVVSTARYDCPVGSEFLRAGLLCLLEVPTVQVEGHRAEVFREKGTRVTINDESESGPLGEYL
jgi:hypothetical protein